MLTTKVPPLRSRTGGRSPAEKVAGTADTDKRAPPSAVPERNGSTTAAATAAAPATTKQARRRRRLNAAAYSSEPTDYRYGTNPSLVTATHPGQTLSHAC